MNGKLYNGPVQAVILDWAGTTVDHGCLGPVAVFSRAFEKFGIEPTVAETREPMGREKREHVAAMLATPRIAGLWSAKHGALPDEKAIDAVFATVQELMPHVLADYGEPVPGCVEAMQTLRKRGIKIGSCTGYSRAMMTELLPAAERKGYKPDCLVTADEVPAGRPMPWMCWQNCMRLGVFPPQAVVKVGDTIADIREGLNAGHFSVAVTRTSNSIGLTADDAAALGTAELERRERKLAREFRMAGAHYVISSIAELPELCDEISACLANGRQP